MPIIFITGNANKFGEASAIVPGLTMEDIDLPEIQDLEPQAVIRAKLAEAAKRRPGPFVVEDTSLSLECLGGLPGTFIKWFLQSMGPRGLYEIASRFKDFRATALTMIGYMDEAGEVRFFEGRISGSIIAPRGETKFGWDPVFRPSGHLKTFAEMTKEEKNAISMRRKAFEGLRAHLESR